MKKFILQFLAFCLLFFAIWFILSQIHYMDDSRYKDFSRKSEEKAGEVLLDFFRNQYGEIRSDTISLILDTIKNRICIPNQLDPEEIRIDLINNKEVNAFALPGGRIIVFSGLITACLNPEELSGVLAHEIAHITHHHVMKKLKKELGLSILATLAGGDSGTEILKEAVRLVSSTAYDRQMEKEADESGVLYLLNAGIDPEDFSNFLFRLSKKPHIQPDVPEWISTHPLPEERVATILNLRKMKSFEPHQVLTGTSWNQLKFSCN